MNVDRIPRRGSTPASREAAKLGLKSGTAAYAKWWKAQNPERTTAQKKRYHARRTALRAPAVKARREAAFFRDGEIIRFTAQGCTAADIAAVLDTTAAAIANRRERLGLKVPRLESYGFKAGRRNSLHFATPRWVDRDELTEVYREAHRRRHEGEDVQVDHVVPLNGAGVCGLHVPWNLQIIPRLSNLVKSNRWEENLDLL